VLSLNELTQNLPNAAMRLRVEEDFDYAERPNGSRPGDHFFNNGTPQMAAGNIIGHKTHDVWGQR